MINCTSVSESWEWSEWERKCLETFVDCTSVFVKSVLETSLSLGETKRRLKDRFNDYQMVSITTWKHFETNRMDETWGPTERMNVWSLCCVQTDATTPNIVGPTMLRVVASVLSVLCKWMHQVPTILGPAVNLGNDTTYTTLETMCNARVAPTMLEELKGRAVQTDPTLLHYASAITGQKLLPQKFDCFQALRNDSSSAKRRNNVAPICTGL